MRPLPTALALLLLTIPAWAKLPPSPDGRAALAQFNRLGTPPRAAALFHLLDGRGDGRLRLAPHPGLRRYDRNHDGVVSRAEFPTRVDAALIRALDANGDGRLDLAELRPAFAGSHLARAVPPPDEEAPPAAAPRPWCWVPAIGSTGWRLEMPVVSRDKACGPTR